MKFYIAHSFPERHFVRDVLCPALQKMGAETSNPFYETNGDVAKWRPEVKIADEKGECKAFWRLVKKRNKSIVVTDLRLIDDSDGIVAFMNEVTFGTTSEIFYCGVVQKKPVYLITTNARLCEHPWVIFATRKGGIFGTYQDALKVINKRLNKRD